MDNNTDKFIGINSGKRVNLCTLLKDHIGEEFYSPVTGFDMTLKKVVGEYLTFRFTDFQCTSDGRLYADGMCLLYPSRTLFEKYPLDAYSAWREWQQDKISLNTETPKSTQE